MSNAVLVFVDIQNDFCAGGRLAIPDAEAVFPVVNSLMREFRHVVLTQDWHPPDDVSFASSNPSRQVLDRISLQSGEQVLWPDHCAAGSPGAGLGASLRRGVIGVGRGSSGTEPQPGHNSRSAPGTKAD